MDDPNAVSVDEMTLALRKPVKLGELEFRELKLREPTAAEWQQWDKLDGIEADVVAVATVSGVPRGAIEKIGARDLITAGRFLAGFLS